MLDHAHQSAHARDPAQRLRPQPDVHRRDRRRGPALLPVDRGQDQPLRRQGLAPDLPGAREPDDDRVLSERRLDLAALRCAAGGHPLDGGPGERLHHPPRLRDRVRLLRPARAAVELRDQGDPRPLFRRPDQRHHRLRGSRRAGPVRRRQRRAAGARARPLHAAPRPGLSGRDGRRPDHQGRDRALSHVHQPRRVPAAAARGQRRPAPDRAGPHHRPDRRRPLGRLQPQARRHRARERAAEVDLGLPGHPAGRGGRAAAGQGDRARVQPGGPAAPPRHHARHADPADADRRPVPSEPGPGTDHFT